MTPPGAARHACVLALVALACAPALAAPRAPVWHREALPHARPAGAPKRIVSLAPVVTETLFLFGAGDRVVGDTRFCDRPAAAKAVPKVGGYVDISLERVLALAPDLVVAMPSLGQREVLDRLREHGVPVLVVFGDDDAEVHAMLRGLGDVLGTQARAAAVDASLDAAERALAALHLPPLRVAVVVGTEPLVVAGPHTFAADAVTRTGLTLAVPKSAPQWPVWSLESLAAAHVDILVAAEGPDARKKLDALVTRAFPAGARPLVVSSTHALLMRPGPALVDDYPELARVLAAAARTREAPPGPR